MIRPCCKVMSPASRLGGIPSTAAVRVLTMMLHWQAVCGGMAFTVMQTSSRDADAHRAGFPFVGEMGGMLTFARDGGTACVIGEGEALQLFVGGRAEHDFNLIFAVFAHIGVTLVRA